MNKSEVYSAADRTVATFNLAKFVKNVPKFLDFLHPFDNFLMIFASNSQSKCRM